MEQKYASDLLKLSTKFTHASSLETSLEQSIESYWQELLKKNINVSTIHSTFAKELLEKLDKKHMNSSSTEWESLKQVKNS